MLFWTRPAFAAALGLALLVATGAAGAAPAAGGAPADEAPAQPAGDLLVDTFPAGAGVWLDGAYIGASPMVFGALPLGRHTVTLTRTGWQTVEFPVVVASGPALIVVRRLRATAALRATRRGTVVVHGARAARDVRIDGEPYVAAPSGGGAPTTLRAGEHRLTAFVGGATVRRAFVVAPDLQTTLVLDATAPDTGARLVEPVDKALPPSAVSIEGRKIVIRVAPHVAVGHLEDPAMRLDGRTVTLDPPPVLVGKRLYLPASFIETLTR